MAEHRYDARLGGKGGSEKLLGGGYCMRRGTGFHPAEGEGSGLGRKGGRRLRTMETGAREVVRHWDEIYGRRLPTEVSWYQDQPTVSLALLDALRVTPDQSIVDVGGGASVLVDRLLDRRFGDVSVLDVSAAALAHAKKRLAERAELVHTCACSAGGGGWAFSSPPSPGCEHCPTSPEPAPSSRRRDLRQPTRRP